MLDSAEYEIILLINVEMPTIVGILTFISRINTKSEGILVFMSSWNAMLSWVEHEKSLKTSWTGLTCDKVHIN